MLNQQNGENDHRKFIMIDLHERILTTRRGWTRNLLMLENTFEKQAKK